MTLLWPTNYIYNTIARAALIPVSFFLFVVRLLVLFIVLLLLIKLYLLLVCFVYCNCNCLVHILFVTHFDCRPSAIISSVCASPYHLTCEVVHSSTGGNPRFSVSAQWPSASRNIILLSSHSASINNLQHFFTAKNSNDNCIIEFCVFLYPNINHT